MFGLDRRTFPFAAAALAVWALWALVLPWINEQVGWDDTIRAGERIQVTDEVSFAPAAGWGLISGLRTTDRTSSGQTSAPAVSLVDGGVQFVIVPGTWDGTPRELLDQITKITTTTEGGDAVEISSRTVAIQTATGVDGVAEGFRSPRSEGIIAALVFGDEGLRIQAVGPPGEVSRKSDEIVRMVESVRRDPAASR
jgi:hypothetical protein